uniref:Uncharacterized protein LOC111104568 n=1 Tax=Crassostrea virginica TaxID=6565 RepID=A0A8B8ASB3_CRAVI|nr:uncharacterized protein LOC111104568 [Crassostrea virginica]XP_022294297.1 uncharacterized protein LOC111104568 [Crassostrea virginica]
MDTSSLKRRRKRTNAAGDKEKESDSSTGIKPQQNKVKKLNQKAATETTPSNSKAEITKTSSTSGHSPTPVQSDRDVFVVKYSNPISDPLLIVTGPSRDQLEGRGLTTHPKLVSPPQAPPPPPSNTRLFDASNFDVHYA